MASTLPPPSGSLVEYLEQMRQAINRCINIGGDENILVTETTDGKELSFVGELGGGAAAPFFGKITGWDEYGTSGKRWKYSWVEVVIGDEVVEEFEMDADKDVTLKDGRTGTFAESANTYLINLAEINNTVGNSDIQGNGTELVAPLGGQDASGATIAHNRIVPIWTASRQDGSVLYWTDVPNSNDIRVNTDYTVGYSVPSSGEDEDTYGANGAVQSDTYAQPGVALHQTGHASEGKKVILTAGVRCNYNHEDTAPKLREFHRQIVFKPNGALKEISAETVLLIDDPESCA